MKIKKKWAVRPAHHCRPARACRINPEAATNSAFGMCHHAARCGAHCAPVFLAFARFLRLPDYCLAYRPAWLTACRLPARFAAFAVSAAALAAFTASAAFTAFTRYALMPAPQTRQARNFRPSMVL
jgi:hypothetical protein